MAEESLRKAVYAEVARIGKALGNATRLELLELLTQRPWTVEALAREAGESVANVSHHADNRYRMGVVRVHTRPPDAFSDRIFVGPELAGRRCVDHSHMSSIEGVRLLK